MLHFLLLLLCLFLQPFKNIKTTPMRMAVRKKTVTSTGEEGSILSPPRCRWEREHLERRLAAPNSKRLFISNSTPSYAPRRNGTCPHEDSCVNVHSSRTETRRTAGDG